jgi:D-alanyl-D-alanine carboxypeptidase/D-alanyl-D-alanine-endopeptidase (penicillin-binding protein 4)
MRAYIVILFLALLVPACAPTVRLPLRKELPIPPITALSVSPYPMLKAQIDSLVSDTLFPPSNIGIEIASLATGEVLYDLNSRMLFNPASNQKLYTSSTALSLLGEDFPLITRVILDTSSQTIWVKAYGDPILTTADMDSIARSIGPLIPRGKRWNLAGDLSYFDDIYWGEGWAWDDEPESYSMYISPLCLNGNAIVVRTRPGRRAGDQVQVEVDPPTGYVTVENSATTVEDSAAFPLVVSRRWKERTNTITVSGEMPLHDTLDKSDVSIWHPEWYALTVLAERLESAGIAIDSISIDTTNVDGPELLRFSHRLDSVVTYMDKVSDNLSAEVLLKVLAAEKRGPPGTARAGLSVVKEFIASIGVDTTTMVMVDGSGLSRYDLLPPAGTVQLLEGMYRQGQHFGSLSYSLPIAGVDGTIKNRMSGTPAQGNLRAKTGTLSTVTALSGYVRTADGEPLAFSIMIQHAPHGIQLYRRVQDKIGILLSQLKREDL